MKYLAILLLCSCCGFAQTNGPIKSKALRSCEAQLEQAATMAQNEWSKNNDLRHMNDVCTELYADTIHKLNAQEKEYQRLLDTIKKQDAEYNQLVTKYNTLLTEYKTFLQVSTSLTPNYNIQTFPPITVPTYQPPPKTWFDCTSSMVGNFVYTNCN